MKSIAMIPARMGSSRFPGKPMANGHSFSVYTQTDLHNLERKMENDKLMKTYI